MQAWAQARSSLAAGTDSRGFQPEPFNLSRFDGANGFTYYQLQNGQISFVHDGRLISIPLHDVPDEIDGFFRLARRRRSE
jgi:hypothetical protein